MSSDHDRIVINAVGCEHHACASLQDLEAIFNNYGKAVESIIKVNLFGLFHHRNTILEYKKFEMR
ncbi:hypothetical protein BpHYR1_015212 [Brachionus plicatilis]|uniref:Uncharacterized protein n=1 Tax=Brachionus plicatilis TaxID=10195 RepID=A0A3M7PI45_BRAPC|nr:hypothetical protein BpHYR1_015212 [Brachionus plicatilis]